ncbi:MAG: hypothetical protein ACI8ZM_001232 [Crocinitomix sp.]|jgi:hypothetical protein
MLKNASIYIENQTIFKKNKVMKKFKNTEIKKKFENNTIKNLSVIIGGKKSKNRTDFQEENDIIWG